MKSSRLFIKVHNGFPEHPKTGDLSDRAFRNLIELWCYCSRNLTDGMVSNAQANRILSAKSRRELVTAGFMDERPDGVEMRNYLEHQQSAQEVADLRERRAQAGSKGGKAKANRLANAKQPAKQTPSKPVADTDTDLDTEPKNKDAAASSSATPRKRPATRLPDDWTPTEQHWERRHDGIDVQREADTFKAHAEANDRRCVNWNAAFTQWLLKARPAPTGRPEQPSNVQQHLALARRLAEKEQGNTIPFPQIDRSGR